MFRVTYDAETQEVWFQTSLAQRKGAFGTTSGGDQVCLTNGPLNVLFRLVVLFLVGCTVL